jgi:ribonuclease HI
MQIMKPIPQPKNPLTLTTEKLFLFTDGSVNTKTNAGWGAFLAVFDNEVPPEKLIKKVKLKRFERTSSSKLEIQTLIWALSEVLDFKGKVTVYTDSQTIVGLPDRRVRLEKNDYLSKSGRLINSHELYREFFAITDQINCEFIKIKGHNKTSLKDNVDWLFTIVDRASRNAVRGEK